MSIRIVVGGVANCGKSTFTASIYRQLQVLGISAGIHELDVFENTIPYILGIESWEQRQKVKSGDWDDPRVGHAMDAFLEDKSHFVLGDLTGIIDGLLERMVKSATAAVAIGKDEESLKHWLDFFGSQKIPVILKILSYLDDVMPQTSFNDIVFVGNLKRKVLRNDEIFQATNRLLAMCGYTG